MRKQNSILEFTYERQRDLIYAYRKLLRTRKQITSDIYREVAESPSPRFWVSEERALYVIKAMIEGKPLDDMRPLKREMFEEIYKRVMRMRKVFPDRPLPIILRKIIYMPAPKFYLDSETVRIYIGRAKKMKETL